MRKSLTKRLEDIEKGVNTATDTKTIRMKVLCGKEKLTPDEIRALDADSDFSKRAERLLAEIDKGEKLYQKQLEDSKHVDETEPITDVPIQQEPDAGERKYAGNTDPIMHELPEFFRTVDYSR